ncbi:lysylphosphatidylglycerol synthase domain-containing protein [Gemmatimonas sp.]|uniref:lysylphosphatidylglycerol synthase transmembrane domain-containing protein n=1 Tax=Gemmatimonas sp. TaxID=1962908 RepID=UPI0025C3AC8C|nr:lysylphosphatidylglycerol synthase domain-containing protein [Gemmatimonas sp.]MCA2993026.1 flippase-like domain-containing protein [Gemmatimonas sp.]
MSWKRWLVTLLSFGLMLGISAWVVARHWPANGMPWLAWPVHLAALATVTAEIATRAFKIQASARACRIPLSFGTALRVCLAGDLAAAITPARSGAEPARFLVLAESGTGAAQRVLVLFLELFLEMWSLVLVCSVLAVLFAGRGASTGGLLALVGGYSTVVLGAGAAGWFLSRRNANGPPPAWARALGLAAPRWRAVQRTLRSLRGAVTSLRRAKVGLMLLAFGGSVLHVLFKVATLPILVFLGDPAFPRTMDTLAPLVLWPLALFYGGVVVPAPGGGGFIEGAFAATLSTAIPAGIFVAALLWWRFYTFYLYILIGGLAAGDAALRALRPASPSS